MTLKSVIFTLLANRFLLGTSGGHLQVHHICLKKYFSSSRQFLDKIFVKNNHHLDIMQGFISTSGVNTAFFHPKKWQNMLKIDFLRCHGDGQAEKRKGPIFPCSCHRRKKYTNFQENLRHVISDVFLVLINNHS